MRGVGASTPRRSRGRTPCSSLAECGAQLQTSRKSRVGVVMGKQDSTCSPEQIAETASTLSWLSEQLEINPHAVGSVEAQMVDALSLARSYVVEFAVHRSLGFSDSEAIAATARREL